MSKGLEFFKIECGTFSSPFVKTLTRKHPAGVAVYFRLLDDAYKTEGYFIRLDDDLIDDICLSFNLSSEQFTEILEFLKAREKVIELNHEKLGRIITSESLQIGFSSAAKERARKRNSKTYPVDDQIWILPPAVTLNDDGENYITFFFAEPPDTSAEPPDTSAEPPRNLSESPRTSKQSRVEKSRVEKSKEEKSESRADTHPAHRHSGMSSVSDVIEDLSTLNMIKKNLRYFGFSDSDISEEEENGQLKRMIERYSPEWMLQAAERASTNGLPNFKYFTGILNKWEEQGGTD